MQIGDRIAIRRKELGLTQDELAARTGYKSKAAISKIETNVNDIAQSAVVRFAEALDTTVAYLMGWEDLPAHKDPIPKDFIQLFAENPDQVARDEALLEAFRALPPSEQEIVIAQTRGLVHRHRGQGSL